MRTIKFRAWNKETKQYELPTYRGNASLDINDILRGSTLIYQQFTGLLDKNGKEIYEGDILLLESEEKNVIIEETGEGPIEEYNQLLPVTFERGAFGLKPESDYMFTNHFHTFSDIENNSGQVEFEIIGNLYENPELLTN